MRYCCKDHRDREPDSCVRCDCIHLLKQDIASYLENFNKVKDKVQGAMEEPVKPQSVWSLVSAGPPALLFYPPAIVLPGESCNDHENGLVEKDEGQLDAATKAESQASPRNGT